MAELPAALLAIGRELSIAPADMSLSLENKPGEDYSESWKRDLAPIEIAAALVIAPSWWDGPLPGPAEAAVLRLDPGSAFGSGHHPTTFICLRLLCELKERGLRPASILDLGAGSGVLALSAALLFPEASISAVDNDPETLFCAKANAALNSLGGRVEPLIGALSDLEGEFELIMANLVLGSILDLAPELSRKARPAGRLFLSGLLASQAQAVIKALEAFDFVCERHLGMAEWSGLSLARGLAAKAAPERIPLAPQSAEDSQDDGEQAPGEAMEGR
jgi:ribosomal protein L11 methyltransferase